MGNLRHEQHDPLISAKLQAVDAGQQAGGLFLSLLLQTLGVHRMGWVPVSATWWVTGRAMRQGKPRQPLGSCCGTTGRATGRAYNPSIQSTTYVGAAHSGGCVLSGDRGTLLAGTLSGGDLLCAGFVGLAVHSTLSLTSCGPRVAAEPFDHPHPKNINPLRRTKLPMTQQTTTMQSHCSHGFLHNCVASRWKSHPQAAAHIKLLLLTAL